jgi:flagellar hook protein FlgE
MTQNGSPPGQMVGYKMSTDGVITASYSNGQTTTMGQVVLASFKNSNSLASAANNQWLETTDSGQASLNTAGAGGLGTLQASAKEDANVDLTSEMIKMISAQRIFQAAAEMVKKQDQIMQTVINIGQ